MMMIMSKWALSLHVIFMLQGYNSSTQLYNTGCVYLSSEFKPKKIKTENDKKAKKRKQENEVKASGRLRSCDSHFSVITDAFISEHLYFPLLILGHQVQKNKGQKRRSSWWKKESKARTRREVEMVS